MKLLRRVEIATGAAISAAAVILFAFNAAYAGALWRDEANTVGLATLPSFSDVWANLQYDSFPVLWMAIIRGVAAIAGAMNDTAFRFLGLAIGVLLIVSIWLNAKAHGYQVPLIALPLIGLSPSVVRWGGSLRAYGLGMTAAFVTSVAIWMYVQEPSRRRMVAAALCSILSVHILYYNAPVILALCVAGAGVCLMRRNRTQLIGLLVIGGLAALSLLIYIPTFAEAASWNPLVQIPNYDFRWFMYKLNQTVAAGPLLTMLWMFIALFGAAAAALELRKKRLALNERDRASITFALVLLITVCVSQYVFLKRLSYLTQPWYYLTLLGMSAIAADIIFARLAVNSPARIVRLSVAVGIAALTIPATLHSVREPMTNVDKVAGILERSATTSDRIILSPWYLGVSFSRYYEGTAPWMMLPTVEFHRFHRYSQMREMMLMPDQRAPAQKAIDAALATLKSGGTVYFVDEGELAKTDLPKFRGPALLPDEGWKSSAYQRLWTALFVFEMRKHAASMVPIDIAFTGGASRFELLTITAMSGWVD